MANPPASTPSVKRTLLDFAQALTAMPTDARPPTKVDQPAAIARPNDSSTVGGLANVSARRNGRLSAGSREQRVTADPSAHPLQLGGEVDPHSQRISNQGRTVLVGLVPGICQREPRVPQFVLHRHFLSGRPAYIRPALGRASLRSLRAALSGSRAPACHQARLSATRPRSAPLTILPSQLRHLVIESAAGLHQNQERRAMDAKTPTRGRPFPQGNPGRKRGKKSNSARGQPSEGTRRGAAPQAVVMAMGGNVHLMKFLLGRILPRERPVALTLPRLDYAHDSADAMAEIVDAVSSGRISPREAADLSEIISAFIRAIDITDAQTEIDALKVKLGIGRLKVALSRVLWTTRDDRQRHESSYITTDPTPYRRSGARDRRARSPSRV